MVYLCFYKAVKPKHATQGPHTRTRPPRVILSKEAKALLRVRRKSAQTSYQQDLAKLCNEIDESAAKIAETHSKSFQRVLLALNSGHRNLSRARHNKSSAWNAYVRKRSSEAAAGRWYNCYKENMGWHIKKLDCMDGMHLHSSLVLMPRGNTTCSPRRKSLN
jgi:hypothetical protein